MTRPATVPADAQWSDAQQAWIAGSPERGGLVSYYRADGSPWCEYTYAGGVLHGPFRRFHDNGEVASHGDMAAGRFAGTNVVERSRAPSSEAFPEQLGAVVWRYETDYDANGAPCGSRMFDAAGRQLTAEELLLSMMNANPHVAAALKGYSVR
jgi:hypothetical protein